MNLCIIYILMHNISLPAQRKNPTLLQVHAAVNLFYKLLTFRFSSGEQLPDRACWIGAEFFVEYATTEAKVAVYTEDEPNGKWWLVNEIIRRCEYI